jgi:hypothetical protein
MLTYYATRSEEHRDLSKGRGVHTVTHYVRRWDPQTLELSAEMKAEFMVMPYKLIPNPATSELDTKSAAVLAREILKERFPGTKFSVRISRFAGGSSITVRWFGEPAGVLVSTLLGSLTARGFDPMTDSTTSRHHLIAWKGTIYTPCFAFIHCNRQGQA